jgi:uncharacterized protein (TIGR00251 family)
MLMDIRQGIVKVRVKTGAPKTEVVGWDNDVLRIAVKARPEKGKANAEIIKLFKKEFKKDVEIVKGLKSRDKLLRIL